jgi:hypothetical protein
MRMLARSVADSVRIDSEHSPVREAETRARLAAVLAELSGAVRAYGQLLEVEPVSGEDVGHVGLAGRAGLAGVAGRAGQGGFAAEPLTEVLEDHLEEARRQQDQLADLLSTNPAEQPEGWPLRGEILSHVDRLRSELQPGRLPSQMGYRDQARVRQPLQALRHRRRDARTPGSRANRTALRVQARRTAGRVRAGRRG